MHRTYEQKQKARDKLMAEAKESAKHLPPVVIDTPPEFAELAQNYNDAQAYCKELLTALLYACVQDGGPKRVEFGIDAWSNIQGRDRFDLATQNFVDKYIHYITAIR